MSFSFNEKIAPATFLIGGAGAGKTELAINLAVWKHKRYKKATLVDFDIVNPFFRVRKLATELEKTGIQIVKPIDRVVAGDLPALPPAAWGALEDTEMPVVFDIGGGEPGLRPLGRMKELAKTRKANVFFVINTFRPEFDNIKDLSESFEHLCSLCQLEATHIVANPNLSNETNLKSFNDGLKLINELAATKKIQVAFAMTHKTLASSIAQLPAQMPDFNKRNEPVLFVIDRYWSVPWQFGI